MRVEALPSHLFCEERQTCILSEHTLHRQWLCPGKQISAGCAERVQLRQQGRLEVAAAEVARKQQIVRAVDSQLR